MLTEAIDTILDQSKENNITFEKIQQDYKALKRIKFFKNSKKSKNKKQAIKECAKNLSENISTNSKGANTILPILERIMLDSETSTNSDIENAITFSVDIRKLMDYNNEMQKMIKKIGK